MKICILLLTVFILVTMFCGCKNDNHKRRIRIKNNLIALGEQLKAETNELENVLTEYFKDKGAWPQTIDDVSDFAKKEGLAFNKEKYSSMTFMPVDGGLDVRFTTTDGGGLWFISTPRTEKINQSQQRQSSN